MAGFFKGWRRKVGCITLVIALALTGAWARSIRIDDAVRVTLFGRRHLVRSFRSQISWWSWSHSDIDDPTPLWTSDVIKPPEGLIVIDGVVVGFNGSFLRNFPHYDLKGAMLDFDTPLEQCDVPIWSLVLPLTLLSAYMILRNPRRVLMPVASPIVNLVGDSPS